jgi:C4-dicarboxylate transporter
METIKELLELVKQTPEMALWALGFYFVFVLLKLSSWIFVLKVIIKQFIQRFFDYKEKSLNNKRGYDIAQMFENNKISNVDYNLLIELLDAVKADNKYIHEHYIRGAINKIKK